MISAFPPVAPGQESPPASSVLQVQGLTIAYGGREALRTVDLGFPECSITALVGPSGCGKSSLLMAINRLTDLIPGCRVTGRVLFRDRDVRSTGVDVVEIRRRVGMIFQRPNPFPVSIRKNIELPLAERRRTTRAERDEAVTTVLEAVGLWDEVKDRLDQGAPTLSGGQQQRLCIARALVLEPEVLLLDEPCSALDPLASGVVEELIVSLAGRYTIVVVTHNLAQARRIADRVAFFWLQDGAGALVEQGSREAMFDRPRHELTAAYFAGDRG